MFTACSVQLGTKRNYKVVEENYWVLFWYINKLVLRCTEATVLLNVYPVFVSKFDFDCESNIRLLIEERITTLSKMFLLFSSSFLSRIQSKKVEGQTFLGFVLLIWLSVYFVAGKTIFRCLISACLHCLWQKNTLTLGST